MTEWAQLNMYLVGDPGGGLSAAINGWTNAKTIHHHCCKLFILK